MKNLLFVLVFTFIGQQSNVIYAQEFTVTPTGLKDNANLNNVLVIPQIGNVDSLNLSVAASLCIVESRRQKGLLSTAT